MAFKKEEHLIRFNSYVGAPTPSGCREWQGGVSSNGYGVFWLEGKSVAAHRIACELAHGPIPPGMFACHHCDNPRCVNPDHLFTGTPSDNLKDAIAKGRKIGKRGQTQWRAKLTNEQAVEAARLVASGVRGTDVARRFGVHPNTVYNITRGRQWKQVLAEANNGV